jgi:hypothetical protein
MFARMVASLSCTAEWGPPCTRSEAPSIGEKTGAELCSGRVCKSDDDSKILGAESACTLGLLANDCRIGSDSRKDICRVLA